MKAIEILNSKLIEMMEQGINPWKRPWMFPQSMKGLCDPEHQPVNYKTMTGYSILNSLFLEPGYYLTFNQCKELGGHIRKGAEGSPVFFFTWNTYQKPTAEGEEPEEVDIPTLKYYTVFKLEDCKNIREIKYREPKFKENPAKPSAEEIIADYQNREKVKIINEPSAEAYYTGTFDEVHMPLLKQFVSSETYYSTMFHELTHSTGYRTRLNREGITDYNRFGDENYSKEELVAEIGAAYACNYLGIENDQTLENSAAYLKSWAKHLKGNSSNNFIISAMAKAKKAFELIFNCQEEEK